jgi:hypothetical protein
MSWIDSALSQARAARNHATPGVDQHSDRMPEAPNMCSNVQRGPESM